jgi:hypothetical protein
MERVIEGVWGRLLQRLVESLDLSLSQKINMFFVLLAQRRPPAISAFVVLSLYAHPYLQRSHEAFKVPPVVVVSVAVDAESTKSLFNEGCCKEKTKCICKLLEDDWA